MVYIVQTKGHKETFFTNCLIVYGDVTVGGTEVNLFDMNKFVGELCYNKQFTENRKCDIIR